MRNTLRRIIVVVGCIHVLARTRWLQCLRWLKWLKWLNWPTIVAVLLYGGLSSVASAQSSVPGVPAVDAPHIALMLPVDSSTFRRHAEALRDGFLAASKSDTQQSLL